jgi:hypothetical protein
MVLIENQCQAEQKKTAISKCTTGLSGDVASSDIRNARGEVAVPGLVNNHCTDSVCFLMGLLHGDRVPLI